MRVKDGEVRAKGEEGEVGAQGKKGDCEREVGAARGLQEGLLM